MRHGVLALGALLAMGHVGCGKVQARTLTEAPQVVTNADIAEKIDSLESLIKSMQAKTSLDESHAVQYEACTAECGKLPNYDEHNTQEQNDRNVANLKVCWKQCAPLKPALYTGGC